MQTDLCLFRERLAEACLVRGVSETNVCSSVGLGGKRAISLRLSGPGAIDIDRLCRIADALYVSLDWLTGRSNVLSMPEDVEQDPKPQKRKTGRTAR
jgi:transcriptional regulator with XRE-family HTH domain